MEYRICAWATDDELERADTLEDARATAARLLGVDSPVAAGPEDLPAGALEGWHESEVEECGSVLIYEVNDKD